MKLVVITKILQDHGILAPTTSLTKNREKQARLWRFLVPNDSLVCFSAYLKFLHSLQILQLCLMIVTENDKIQNIFEI